MKTTLRTLAAAVVLLGGAQIGHAAAGAPALVIANLVANGGFETGDFTGWTLAGPDVPGQQDNLYGVEGADPYPLPAGTAPNSGNFQAFFSDVPSNATTLSQALTTTPGNFYTVSFYLAQQLEGPGTVSNSVVVSLDGTTLASLTAVPVQGYTQYSFTTAVADPSSTLSFTFGNQVGEFIIDDVSVTPAAPVPEPATWAQFGAGLLALGWGIARRQARQPR